MDKSQKKNSIKSKLVRMQLLLAFLILIAASTGFILNDLFIFRKSVERSLESTAKILSQNLAPTLVFVDKNEANKILASLQSEPGIATAYLLDANGEVFASYGKDKKETFQASERPILEGSRLEDGHLIFYHKLISDNEVKGILYLDSDLKIFAVEFKSYLWVIFGVFLAGLLMSFGLAHLIQRSLSGPIITLAHTAKKISVSGDYSFRMSPLSTKDEIEEISTLSKEFDQMLDQIQMKDEKILAANSELEGKVERRTQELKDSQLLLVEASKMSALGEMAGGIAHEINTPLGTISLLISKLQGLNEQGTLDQDEIGNILNLVEATVIRIAKIVNGLRTFSRDGAQEPFHEVRVNQIIQDTLALCAEKMKNHGVEVKLGEIADLLSIECRAIQISQVLLNLLNNSYDAIEKLPDKWIHIEVRDQNDQIEITVTDSGPGIPPEIQSKLFQPFFTTKGVGKGTGLGLSISQGIMKAHKGKFTLVNGDKNTKFNLQIPKRQNLG